MLKYILGFTLVLHYQLVEYSFDKFFCMQFDFINNMMMNCKYNKENSIEYACDDGEFNDGYGKW